MRAEDPWSDGYDDPYADEKHDSVIDALTRVTPDAQAGSDGSWSDGNDDLDGATSRPEIFFTVANPAGTLAVTAALGGRLLRIHVVNVSSYDAQGLADELGVLAELARDKALAAQHEVTLELMRGLGQDRFDVKFVLQQANRLPSFEDYAARAAASFSTHDRADD